MKIVLLDAKTLGNNININAISEEGDLTIYETTSPTQTQERIKNADIIILNKIKIGEKELKAAKNLKLICISATGYNTVDIAAANARNIIVTNVKAYSTNSVAQQVFAYLLAFYNSTFQYQHQIRNNKWQKSEIFTILNHPITELTNKTLGIIGYGAIGKQVAKIAKAFDMKIIISKIPGRKYNDNIHLNFENVISTSDIISIHCPLNEQTKNLIAAKELNKMKKNAILINYARGGIINEKDLFNALKNNDIRGAIIDVLTTEPPEHGNILFNAPNIFITPHNAWTSTEARQKLIKGIIHNIKTFKQGNGEKIQIKI